jgi:hypothetical protein
MIEDRPLRRLLRILVIDSISDLIRYKSFLVLVAALIAVDRAVRVWFPVDRHALGMPNWRQLALDASAYVFGELPAAVGRLLGDYRVLVTLTVLFLMKEVISLWPSSDMRRMHRGEREGSSVLASLAILRWGQVAWDACAAGSLVTVTVVWCGVWYALFRGLWLASPSTVWLLLWVGALAAFGPVFLAGMSYSSKLAVIAQGGFAEKLWLFYRLFLDWGVFWRSWALFAIRLIIEGVFVAILPAGALLAIDNLWMRLLVASLIAAPAYSYVKMASFKFFLEVYRKYPRVHDEFREYYARFHL